MNSCLLLLFCLVATTLAACPNNGVLGQDCEGNGKAGKCQSTCGSTSSSDFVARTGCCDRLATSVKCCTVLSSSGGSDPPTNSQCPNTGPVGRPCIGRGRSGVCSSTCSSTSSNDFVGLSGCCDGLPSNVKCCVVSTTAQQPSNACSSFNTNGVCPSNQRCFNGRCQTVSSACSSFNPGGSCPTGQTCTNGSCQSNSNTANCPNARRTGQPCEGAGRVGVCSSTCRLTDSSNFVPLTGCCDGLASNVKCCVAGTSAPSTACSPTNQSGTCPSNQICQNGSCRTVSNACSSFNTEGSCPTGQTCTNGACRTTSTTNNCPRTGGEGRACVGNGRTGVCSSTCSSTTANDWVALTGCCDGLPSNVKCCVVSTTAQQPSNACSSFNLNGVCPSNQRCFNGRCQSVSNTCSSFNPEGSCPTGQTCTNGACVLSTSNNNCPNARQPEQPCQAHGRVGRCSSSCRLTDSSNFVGLSGCCDGLPSNVKCCLAGDFVPGNDGSCSSANPTGPCPRATQICQRGVCRTRSNVCSTFNTEGICDDGQTCINGSCSSNTLCSASNLSGTCPSNQICQGGRCRVVSDACSSFNTDGSCPTGQTCTNGSCRASSSSTCPNAGVAGQVCSHNGRTGVCTSSCSSTSSTDFVSRTGCCDHLSTSIKCCLTTGSSACSPSNTNGHCSGDTVCRGGRCEPRTAACSSSNRNGACSAGRVCSGGTCVVPSTCSSSNPLGTCSGDLRCQGGRCVASGGAPCSISFPYGSCETGKYCLAGVCTTQFAECSPQNPTGPCSGNQVCDRGTCRAAQVCSSANQSGYCPTGQYCSGGQCIDPNAPCSASNPNGRCPNGLSCNGNTCVSVSSTCPNRGVEGQSCTGNGRTGSCLRSSRCSVSSDPNQFIANTGCCDRLGTDVKCCAPAPNIDPIAPSGGDAQCPNQRRVNQPCRAEGVTGGVCTTSCSGVNRRGVENSSCCERMAAGTVCCIPIAETDNDAGASDAAGVGSTLCTTTAGVIYRGGPCKTSARQRVATTSERFTQLAAAVPSTCSDGYQWIRVRDSSNRVGYLTTALTQACSASGAAPQQVVQAPQGQSSGTASSRCGTVGRFDLSPPPSLPSKRRFYATRYIKPTGQQSANGVEVYEFPSRRVIARVPKAFWCNLHLQGSGVIEGVGLLTFGRVTTGCVRGCAHKRNNACQTPIMFTRSSSPYGEGTYFRSIDGRSTSCWLAPFRSLASDRSIAPGTLVYIPEARGQSFTHGGETRTHDGWHMVCDRGSAITGNKFDYFSGANHEYVPMPFVRSTRTRQFDTYLFSGSRAPSAVKDFLYRMHDARYRCGGAALLQDQDLIDTEAAEEAESGGLTGTATALIVVGVLACVAILCLALFCAYQAVLTKDNNDGAVHYANPMTNMSGVHETDADGQFITARYQASAGETFELPGTTAELARPGRSATTAPPTTQSFGGDTFGRPAAHTVVGGAGVFSCTHCGKNYPSQADLTQHCQLRHPGAEVPASSGTIEGYGGVGVFTCTICQKNYNYQDDLNHHMAKRHGGPAVPGSDDYLAGGTNDPAVAW